MFKPGPLELVIILLIVVAVFGAGKLADIGGTLGKGVKEFRQATREVQEAQKEVVKTQEELAEATAIKSDTPKTDEAAK